LPEAQVHFKPDPALFPFESRWFDSAVGRIHYIDEGEGPAILLLHGNPTWSFLYRKIVSELRSSFRCVAVDCPGFGLSVRPQGYGYTPGEHARVVGDLVDSLDLQDFLVMGQDWGGPVGLNAAVRRADRIKGVVLGNTWFWPVDDLKGKTFSRVMSSRPMQAMILKRNFFVERLIPAGTATKLSDPEMNHYRAVQPTPEARVGVAEYPRQILAARPLLEELQRDVPAELGAKPALLTWGMKDRVFQRDALERVRAAFSDVTVVELPNARHFIQEDAPVEIARAIRERFGNGASPPAAG
jgi:haloalkane dehalogenase